MMVSLPHRLIHSILVVIIIRSLEYRISKGILGVPGKGKYPSYIEHRILISFLGGEVE